MKTKHPFALIELFALIVVLTSIILLSGTTFRRFSAGNADMACKDNLKRLIHAAVQYSLDQGALPVAWDGKHTWVYHVQKAGKFFPAAQNGKPSEFLCPAGEPNLWHGDPSKTYGMADRFQNDSRKGIILSKVENPVDWPVFSDSVKGTSPEQVYIILKDFNGYVAVRHNGKANLAFADGHVAANSESELMRFRHPKYYVDRNFFSYCK